MTEPSQRIPALHTTSPDSIIVRASKGEPDPDWATHKSEYCDRLTSILSSWDTDPASYLEQISAFDAPPHTIQRLSELLDDPSQWYSSSAKYCRALDRVLNVTFTTLDYSTEKEEFESMHHDSPLIPIPWLTRESMTGTADEKEVAHENGSLAGTVSDHSKAVTGSAPMDAADYGPQSEDVKEIIASASTNGHVQDGVVNTQNGEGSAMDET